MRCGWGAATQAVRTTRGKRDRTRVMGPSSLPRHRWRRPPGVGNGVAHATFGATTGGHVQVAAG